MEHRSSAPSYINGTTLSNSLSKGTGEAAASCVLCSIDVGIASATGRGGITIDPSVTVAPLAVADMATAAPIMLIELGFCCGARKAIESTGRTLGECAHEIGKVV